MTMPTPFEMTALRCIALAEGLAMTAGIESWLDIWKETQDMSEDAQDAHAAAFIQVMLPFMSGTTSARVN